MFILGVSGPIGSGKSSIADYFRKKNVPVIDADQLSHEVLDEEEMHEQLEKLLGKDIFITNKISSAEQTDISEVKPNIENIDGQGDSRKINRSAVARIVFSNHQKLDELSLLVHRAVLQRTDSLLKEYQQKKEKLVVLDFPLPVKEGFLDKISYLIVPHTPVEQRISRLMARGMTREDIETRIEIQMTDKAYEDLAQLVISNDSDYSALEQKLDEFVQTELEARGIFLG